MLIAKSIFKVQPTIFITVIDMSCLSITVQKHPMVVELTECPAMVVTVKDNYAEPDESVRAMLLYEE